MKSDISCLTPSSLILDFTKVATHTNLLYLCGVLHKVILPLNVLSLLVKFQILSELDGTSVVTQHLNWIINLEARLRS